MIVGVSGPYGSGKGEVVEFLRQRSFYPLSLSDVLREELRRRGESETRERMIVTGNEIRRIEGGGALAVRLSKNLASDRNYVIDSVRHPAEVRELSQVGQRFIMIWVEAPRSTRLERILKRDRSGDPRDLDELAEYEGRESGLSDYSQQLDEVRLMSNYVVQNDNTREDLYRQLQRILESTLHFERPGWDEYFMGIARVVSTRSNCVKRKVAALITVDKRIISTGYNGTPRGVTNCNEGGCPRCSSFAPGGTGLSECICSHAEENAIVQAAYHGVRVAGGSIYTTFSPCLLCAKMIINAGLSEVVYSSAYPLGESSSAILRQAGVTVRQANTE